MLTVTAAAVRAAEQTAVNDAMNRAGSDAGLSPLMWAGNGHEELVGHIWADDLDPQATARRWAEQLELQPVETPTMDGTVEWRGRLAGGVSEATPGLPITVWAIVDRDRYHAEEAALIERTRRP